MAFAQEASALNSLTPCMRAGVLVVQCWGNAREETLHVRIASRPQQGTLATCALVDVAVLMSSPPLAFVDATCSGGGTVLEEAMNALNTALSTSSSRAVAPIVHSLGVALREAGWPSVTNLSRVHSPIVGVPEPPCPAGVDTMLAFLQTAACSIRCGTICPAKSLPAGAASALPAFRQALLSVPHFGARRADCSAPDTLQWLATAPKSHLRLVGMHVNGRVQTPPGVQAEDSIPAQLATNTCAMLKFLAAAGRQHKGYPIPTHEFEVLQVPDPRFDQLAAAHGTKVAYHGTPSDNTWSILMTGLRSMSGSREETNGSLFGSGIYLAGDPRVAFSFAAPAGQLGSNTVLGGTKATPGALLDPRGNPQQLHSPAAAADAPAASLVRGSFYVVFVAEVIALPSNVAPHSNTTGGSTRSKEGTYFVVADPSHVALRRVLVYANVGAVQPEPPRQGEAARHWLATWALPLIALLLALLGLLLMPGP